MALHSHSFVSILVALLMASAVAFDLPSGDISPDPTNFLRKYALLKLHEECFGKEAIFRVRRTSKTIFEVAKISTNSSENR